MSWDHWNNNMAGLICTIRTFNCNLQIALWIRGVTWSCILPSSVDLISKQLRIGRKTSRKSVDFTRKSHYDENRTDAEHVVGGGQEVQTVRDLQATHHFGERRFQVPFPPVGASLCQIPAIGSISRGTQRQNCSMHGSMNDKSWLTGCS